MASPDLLLATTRRYPTSPPQGEEMVMGMSDWKSSSFLAAPRTPLTLIDDIGDRHQYGSFEALGMDVEFMDEQEPLRRHERSMQCIDHLGQRVRVLAISQETVLAHVVPDSYSPNDLRVFKLANGSTTIYIEVLGRVVVRRLDETGEGVAPYPRTWIEPVDTSGLDLKFGTPADQRRFHSEWMRSRDPAPPVYLDELPGKLLANILNRWGRKG